MTANQLRSLLESKRDSEVLAELGASLARGEGPQVFWEAISMGRMTALRKADGGFRRIVVGNLFRRLVSRTIAQQIAKPVGDRDVAIPICRPSRDRVCQSHTADPH